MSAILFTSNLKDAFTNGNRQVVIERKGAFFRCEENAAHIPEARIGDLQNKTPTNKKP